MKEKISNTYRYQLKSLLGENVVIRGRLVRVAESYKEETNDWVYKALIERVVIKKVPDNYKDKKFDIVSHMWIIVSKDFIQTYNLKINRLVDITGCLYEYIHNNKKNISIQLSEAKLSYDR